MTIFICQYCGSERKNHNSWRNHERCCPLNPNRNYKNGMTGKKGSNQYTKAKKMGLPKPEITEETRKKFSEHSSNYRHTEETKRKISKKLSLNNKGGRSKWYTVNGVKVQGTWEKNVAEILTEKDISWIKPTTSVHIFEYEMKGKKRNYTPDFYLEIKGYWWGDDKEKMEIVMKNYPEVNIMIIEKEEYEKILDGELVW